MRFGESFDYCLNGVTVVPGGDDSFAVAGVEYCRIVTPVGKNLETGRAGGSPRCLQG